jgi:hypothetical protein
VSNYDIASLVGAGMALVLAWQSYRSERVSRRNAIWMAAAWIAIIAAVAFVAGRVAG